MSTYFIVSLLLYITLHYVLPIYTFPFSADKFYEHNEKIYEIKRELGSKWSALLLFVILVILIFNQFPMSETWYGNIFWAIVLVGIAFLIVAIPDGVVYEKWKEYNLQNFPTTVDASITACTPNKFTMQEKHYKSIPLNNNSCTLTIHYEYEGKIFDKTYKDEPITIYYTLEPTDKMPLTISTKNPQFVQEKSIAQVMPFLLERTIDKARFEKDNYGTYIEPEGSSGCGCGCG